MHKRLLPSAGGNDLHTISLNRGSRDLMRVLVLSPGSLNQQLQRLPALASLCRQLDAQLQVACNPSSRSAWDLLPCTEKVLPFGFDTNPTMADWSNLLGCVREPDFQVCINFAEGRAVNLMLSMSHIPTRLAGSGFACTNRINGGTGWAAQQLEPYLSALGCVLDADAFRLTLAAADIQEIRSKQPKGDGPLLLLAPADNERDWPERCWTALPNTIQSRLPGLRSVRVSSTVALHQRALAVACADVVLSSCPSTQQLAAYNGIPLVALGANPSLLPQRPEIRCLGNSTELTALSENDVLKALGF